MAFHRFMILFLDLSLHCTTRQGKQVQANWFPSLLTQPLSSNKVTHFGESKGKSLSKSEWIKKVKLFSREEWTSLTTWDKWCFTSDQWGCEVYHGKDDWALLESAIGEIFKWKWRFGWHWGKVGEMTKHNDHFGILDVHFGVELVWLKQT